METQEKLASCYALHSYFSFLAYKKSHTLTTSFDRWSYVTFQYFFYFFFFFFFFFFFLQGRPSFKSYFVTRYFNFFKKLCRIFVGLLNGFYVDFFSFNFKTLKFFTN
uniref:Uncharacterized protein n=1 Tax=Cacopsylla melanoneura TaxID=428564 RepID=A0A8D9F9W8_9HEMI